jgi:hypothetical protein
MQLCNLRLCVLLAGASVATGCGGESDLIHVTGTVKIDGRPAEGVQVSFWPAEAAGQNSRNRFALGMTGRDGRFEVKSLSEKGIEPGDYKVTFTRSVAGGKVLTDLKKKKDHSRQVLPDRYTDQKTTDQTAKVAKDIHDFVFDISSK